MSFNKIRARKSRKALRLTDIERGYPAGRAYSGSLESRMLIPDEEVAQMPVRENLKTEAIEQKTGWLVWSEMRQGVTSPDILAKIKILG